MSITDESKLTKNQKKVYGPRPYKEGNDPTIITATVRFDDECGNGHNTLSITGQTTNGSGGCIHEEIAFAFPELAKYIRWHLCSTDGPTYYLENVIYLAGDRDHWGLRKGEFRQLKNRKTGVLLWEPDVAWDFARKTVESDQCPDPVVVHHKPYGVVGEGKARELDAARRIAVWPDATDEELCAEPDVLRQKLEARLPALLAEFRRDVEELGFTW